MLDWWEIKAGKRKELRDECRKFPAIKGTGQPIANYRQRLKGLIPIGAFLVVVVLKETLIKSL